MKEELDKKRKKKYETWRLIYPDKTESLMSFDPIKFEREKFEKMIDEKYEKIKVFWKEAIRKENHDFEDMCYHSMTTLEELKSKLRERTQ